MLIFCDIDGTIADCQHRVPLIPDWDAFNGFMGEDEPIKPVILALQTMLGTREDSLAPPPVGLFFITGRPARYQTVTTDWILQHTGLAHYDDYQLLMRPDDDYTSDADLKPAMLDNSMQPGGLVQWWADHLGIGLDNQYIKDAAIFIDDRDRVVAAWRGRGYCCLQPQEGAF